MQIHVWPCVKAKADDSFVMVKLKDDHVRTVLLTI